MKLAGGCLLPPAGPFILPSFPADGSLTPRNADKNLTRPPSFGPSFLPSFALFFPREIIINAEIGKQFVQKPNSGRGRRGRHGAGRLGGVWNLARTIRFLEPIRFFSASAFSRCQSRGELVHRALFQIFLYRCGGRGQTDQNYHEGKRRKEPYQTGRPPPPRRPAPRFPCFKINVISLPSQQIPLISVRPDNDCLAYLVW